MKISSSNNVEKKDLKPQGSYLSIPTSIKQTERSTFTPNLYKLHSEHIKITFATTGIDGRPHLTYESTLQTLTFVGSQIRLIKDTDVSTLVSVTIKAGADSETSISFSILIPRVNLESIGTSVPIQVIGITTIHAHSIIPAFNLGQKDTFDVGHLQGTASHVEF